MDRLLHEFHADHQQIVDALLTLRRALCDADRVRLRAALDAADRLLGPHCKWEEIFLYPALGGVVGEVRVQRLMTQHDGVHRSLRRLGELAGLPAWSGAERAAAHEHWSLTVEHVVACDDLGRYVALLPPGQLAGCAEGLWALRRQSVRLAEYCRERRVA
ncbi:MAG: hemerythrin domain-containing protein [Candidatus Methylomirabilales bacterium]